MAMRIPTPDGSVVDLVVELENDVTKDQVNQALKSAAEGAMKGILSYSEEPLVSVDIIGILIHPLLTVCLPWRIATWLKSYLGMIMNMGIQIELLI